MNMLDGLEYRTIHAKANTCHSTQPSEVHPHWGIVRRDNLIGLALAWEICPARTTPVDLKKSSWPKNASRMIVKHFWKYCVQGWNELPT